MSESHTHTYIMPFGIVRKLLAEDERLAQLTPLWLEFYMLSKNSDKELTSDCVSIDAKYR